MPQIIIKEFSPPILHGRHDEGRPTQRYSWRALSHSHSHPHAAAAAQLRRSPSRPNPHAGRCTEQQPPVLLSATYHTRHASPPVLHGRRTAPPPRAVRGRGRRLLSKTRLRPCRQLQGWHFIRRRQWRSRGAGRGTR